MKKKIWITLIVGACLLFLFGLIFSKNDDDLSSFRYEIVKLKMSEPILFKGTVQPKNISNFNLDLTLGKISNISVQKGQEVNENDVLATYQNTTIEDQAEEQVQSLDKLNLAVFNAQTNYDTAAQRLQELENGLADFQNKRTSINSKKTEENEAKKSELDTKIEAAKQELNSQKDIILQAKQALDSANIDLSSVNNTIEQTKKKITTTVTAPLKGTVYINEKRKIDNTAEWHIHLMNENKTIEGTIYEINDLPDKEVGGQLNTTTENNSMTNFTFMVKPKENIHYGFSVQISVPTNILEIPKNTVIKSDNNTTVFVYKNGKSYKQKVRITETEANYIVEEGLKVNDQLILNPDTHLKDGQEVMVDK